MPRLPSRIVTVREVAAAAGVAFTTAAAALRGDPVSAKTRSRVLHEAKRLGYQRNVAASLLASSGRKRSPGTISLALIYESIGHPPPVPAAQTIPTFETELNKRGMLAQRHHVSSEKDIPKIARILGQSGVDGAILRLMNPRRFLRHFPADSFCLLGQDHGLLPLGIDVVTGSHFSSVLELLREVHARGYRRLGVLLRHHQPRHADDDARRGAVLAFQLEAQATCAVDIVDSPFGTFDPKAIRDWLERSQPDAVVGFNAVEKMIIEAAGWAIPKDVGFAAMSVDPTRASTPAGVVHDQHWTIPLAIELLEEKVRMHQRGLRTAPRQTIAHLPFLDGPSLPRKP